MDVLGLFLDDLTQRRLAGEPLAAEGDAVRPELLQHPHLQAALGRARDSVFRPGETGLLWEGGKNVEIRRSGEWRVLLMQRADPPAYLKTHPQLTLMALLDAGGAEAQVSRRRIEGGVALPAARTQSRLGAPEITPLPLHRWTLAADPSATVDIEADGAPTIALCIQGPRQAPYQHAYRRHDGAYAFTAFADEEVTGRNFFVDLVKRVTADAGFTACLDDGDRRHIAGFMATAAQDDRQPASTRWLALQTVARLDRSRGGEILSAFAQDDDPALAAQARRVTPA